LISWRNEQCKNRSWNWKCYDPQFTYLSVSLRLWFHAYSKEVQKIQNFHQFLRRPKIQNFHHFLRRPKIQNFHQFLRRPIHIQQRGDHFPISAGGHKRIIKISIIQYVTKYISISIHINYEALTQIHWHVNNDNKLKNWRHENWHVLVSDIVKCRIPNMPLIWSVGAKDIC